MLKVGEEGKRVKGTREMGRVSKVIGERATAEWGTGGEVYDAEDVFTRKPVECPYCCHTHFHKTETRLQVYEDLVNNQIVTKTIKRQRYRCAGCSMKVWDQVENLDTYRRKTYRLLRHLGCR